MAILEGTIASFAQSSEASVSAYCIDRGLNTPSHGAKFSSLAGPVRLTFLDGTKQVVDFSEAGQYVQVSGAGTFQSLKLSRIDPRVTKVECLSHSIATEGTAEDAIKSQKLIEETIPKHPGEDIQGDIWHRFLWTKTTSGQGVDKVTTLEYRRRDPEHTLKQSIMRLSSTGDAILIATPNGTRILIDTGFSNGDSARISQALAGHSDLAIITHPDRDHSGNFVSLQSATPFKDVVRSGWESGTLTAQAIDSLASGYVEMTIGTSSMQLYQTESTQPTSFFFKLFPPISVKPAAFIDDRDIPIAIPLAVARVRVDPTVTIQLFQAEPVTSSNGSSIATLLTHNGYSTLYASDITPNAMRLITARDVEAREDMKAFGDVYIAEEFMLSKYPAEAHALSDKYSQYGPKRKDWPDEAFSPYGHDLAAAVSSHKEDPDFEQAVDLARHRVDERMFSIAAATLKWPHHAWVPKSESDQEAVIDFISSVQPRRIIFSVGPQDLAGQSVEAVKQFLNRNFPDAHFEYYVTQEDGSLELLSESCGPQQNAAGLAA